MAHTIETYHSLTVHQLWEVARYNRLHGYSNMRSKAALVNFMYDNKVDIPDYLFTDKKKRVGRPLGKPRQSDKKAYYCDDNGNIIEVTREENS